MQYCVLLYVTASAECNAVCFSWPPDVHTEAVQAALAKHKERKMAVPMPSKRRSLVVQTSMDAYTPPGEPHPSSLQADCFSITTLCQVLTPLYSRPGS